MPRQLLLFCCLFGAVGYAGLLRLGSALGGMGDGFPGQPHGFLSRLADVTMAGGPFVYFTLTGIWCAENDSRRWVKSAAIISHLGLLPLLWMLIAGAFIPFGAPALIYFFASLFTLLDSGKKGPTKVA